MDKKTEANGDIIIKVEPCDVESAIRAFICACYPELSRGYLINPHSTKVDVTFNEFIASK